MESSLCRVQRADTLTKNGTHIGHAAVSEDNKLRTRRLIELPRSRLDSPLPGLRMNDRDRPMSWFLRFVCFPPFETKSQPHPGGASLDTYNSEQLDEKHMKLLTRQIGLSWCGVTWLSPRWLTSTWRHHCHMKGVERHVKIAPDPPGLFAVRLTACVAHTRVDMWYAASGSASFTGCRSRVSWISHTFLCSVGPICVAQKGTLRPGDVGRWEPRTAAMGTGTGTEM